MLMIRPTTSHYPLTPGTLLLGLLLVLLSPSSPANDSLPNFIAEYTVSRNGNDIGVRTHRLFHTGHNYLYEATMHTTGLASLFKPGTITERSHGRLHQQRIVPQRYEYLDSSNTARNAYLKFDWNRLSVTNHVGNTPWQMSIPLGAQDKFGYMLSLMQDLKQGQTTTEYKIADGGRLKTYLFTALGNEVIVTPAGKYTAVKLRRTRLGKNNRITYIWCLPEKHYLPIKIERHKKDTIYTMLLSHVSGL